jgi:hypothetical protein
VPQRVEGFGFHRPRAPLLRRVFAVSLHLLHDRRPGALREQRVTRGETRFENELPVARVSLGLAFDFQQPQGRVTVFGFERMLFARARILQIEGFPTAIQIEPLLHRDMIQTEGVTPLGCSGRWLPNRAGVVSDCSWLTILLAVLLAIGGFSHHPGKAVVEHQRLK